MNTPEGKIGHGNAIQPGVQEKDARDRVGGREDIQRVFRSQLTPSYWNVIDGGVASAGVAPDNVKPNCGMEKPNA